MINEGPAVSPDHFGKSFLDICPSVSLGSEGHVKTGCWGRIAYANFYPFLVADALKHFEQPYQFKKWFFEIYERNNQKIIKKLKEYELPHLDFVQDRSKDILDSLKSLADPEQTEDTLSKNVFKLALAGFYGCNKARIVYKALCTSKGESDSLTAEMRSKFLKVWEIVYPSFEASKIKDIINQKKPPMALMGDFPYDKVDFIIKDYEVKQSLDEQLLSE